MKDYIDEMKRSVFSIGMLISLIIAVIINFVVMKNYFRFSFYKRLIEPWFVRPTINNGGLYSGTIQKWTLFEAVPYYIYIMFVLPIMAVIPYGSRLFFERRSGQLKNQLIRQSRVSYAIKKFISMYASGGIAVTLPLLVSLMITYAVWPYHETTQIYSDLAFSDWFKRLYYTNTWAFVLLTFFAWFIYGGLLVSIN